MSEDFRQGMAKEGVLCKQVIVSDGKVHRFSNNGRGNKDCWYACHGEIGVFGDWHEDGYKKWYSDTYKNLSDIKKNEYNQSVSKSFQEITMMKQAQIEDMATQTSEIWKNFSESGESDYLIRKKIGAHGIRFDKNLIVLPLRDEMGKLWSIQKIYENGDKRFLSGGRKKGLMHILGEIKDREKFFIAEGYATAATVYETTKIPVVVALDIHNMENVTETLRKKYPRNQIVIIGDDDIFSPVNIGRSKAIEISQKYDCKFIFPVFKDLNTKPKDFNDLLVLEGSDIVRNQLISINSKKVTKMSGGKIFNVIMKEPEVLFYPFLPEQGLIMIYAPRGVGKTFLTLSIACAAAFGKDLMNGMWYASKPHKVFYLDGEMSLPKLQKRFKSIVKGMGSDCMQYIDNISFFNPDMDKTEIPPNLGTLEGQLLVEESLEDTNILVIDNLSCLVRGIKENEAESWGIVQDWLMKLKVMGISVILVHHSNKTGGQRGTSKKEDLLDAVISLKRPNDYTPENGCRFEVHFEKARDFYNDEAKPFEVSLCSDQDIFTWKVKDLEDAKEEKVIKLYKQGLKQHEIVVELGISKATVCRIINKAKSMGFI